MSWLESSDGSSDRWDEENYTEHALKLTHTKWVILLLLFLLLIVYCLFYKWKENTQGKVSSADKANYSFEAILSYLRKTKNLSSEMNDILSAENIPKWKLLPSQGKDRVYLYPKATGQNEYWEISYQPGSNDWILKDPPYYGNPYPRVTPYAYHYPYSYPNVNPYAYAYSNPYSYSYSNPYAYSGVYPYSYSAYSYPYNSGYGYGYGYGYPGINPEAIAGGV